MTNALDLATIDSVSFEDVVGFSAEQLDALPFGVVGLAADGLVTVYSATEERYAGMSRDKVVGVHYFNGVAQCMNNFMVAQRFEDEPDLDVVIDYVLTFRMRPTPVRLRLMQKPGAALRYILIQR